MILPPISISPCVGIVRISDAFDESMSCALPDGRLTLRPVFFSTSDCSTSFLDSACCLRDCSTSASAVTMKMTTITRKTSVSGVMLISAKIPSLASSASSPPSGSFPSAIFLSFHLRVDFIIRWLLLLATARLRVLRCIEQQLEELVGEELHLRRDPARALAEVVEQDDRLDGDENTDRRHDQRFGYRTGDVGEADLLPLMEAAEAGDDAGDRAEQTDERCRRTDRSEHPQSRAQVLIHAQPLTVHARHDVVGLRVIQPLVADEEHVRDRARRALARRASLFDRTARQAPPNRIGELAGACDELPLRDGTL